MHCTIHSSYNVGKGWFSNSTCRVESQPFGLISSAYAGGTVEVNFHFAVNVIKMSTRTHRVLSRLSDGDRLYE